MCNWYFSFIFSIDFLHLIFCCHMSSFPWFDDLTMAIIVYDQSNLIFKIWIHQYPPIRRWKEAFPQMIAVTFCIKESLNWSKCWNCTFIHRKLIRQQPIIWSSNCPKSAKTYKGITCISSYNSHIQILN